MSNSSSLRPIPRSPTHSTPSSPSTNARADSSGQSDTRRRKSYRRYTTEDLHAALIILKQQKEPNFRGVARSSGIPATTLHRMFRGMPEDIETNADLMAKNDHSGADNENENADDTENELINANEMQDGDIPVKRERLTISDYVREMQSRQRTARMLLSLHEEDQLVEWMRSIRAITPSFSNRMLVDKANELIRSRNVEETVSKAWLRAFKRRHADAFPEFSQASSQVKTASALKEDFLALYVEYFQRLGSEIDPNRRVLLLGEISIEPAAEKKKHRVQPLSNGKHLPDATKPPPLHVSLFYTLNSEGLSGAPFMTFCGENIDTRLLRGYPPDTGMFMTQDGHSSPIIMKDIITHILHHFGGNQPLMLLYDLEEDLFDYKALEFCAFHNIQLLRLPTNSSIALRASPKGFIGIFKHFMTKELDDFAADNDGGTPTLYDLCPLIGSVWSKLNPLHLEVIRSTFTAAGVWPINPFSHESMDLSNDGQTPAQQQFAPYPVITPFSSIITILRGLQQRIASPEFIPPNLDPNTLVYEWKSILSSMDLLHTTLKCAAVHLCGPEILAQPHISDILTFPTTDVMTQLDSSSSNDEEDDEKN